MEQITIDIVRYKYSADTTLGKLYINKEYICNTLEDAVRPYGIKIKGKTAIFENPNGYMVGIKYSPKFKREVLVLYTEADGETINHGGIKFGNVYLHGGNTHADTEGCILVAKNVNVNNMTIQGTMEKDIMLRIKPFINALIPVKCTVTNLAYTDVH